MATNPNVEAEETAEESLPETTQEDLESSEDTSSEETLTTDEKPSRPDRDKANERIREIIAERKALQQERDYWKSLAAQTQTTTQQQYDGVTDEGIDPQKYANSLAEKIRQDTATLTQQQIRFEAERTQVALDPLLQVPVHQVQVSNLINQGYSPLDALAIYKDELKLIEEDVLKRSKARSSADKAAKSQGQLPSAGKTTSSSSTFTNADIEKMSLDEYRQNQAEIKRQYAAGLIK